MKHLLCFALLIRSAASFCQTVDLEKIRSFRTRNEGEILQDLVSFLRIPNLATDTANIEKNAVFLMQLMKARGLEKVSLLRAGEHPPVAYGEVRVPGASRTVIFYAHYDGQPVNPATWARGLHPFQPRLLRGRLQDSAASEPLPAVHLPLPDDWRIYARGSSDDKGGVMAILTAYDAIRQAGLKLHCNIKFFFEGEEEQGSPHLQPLLVKYKDLLQSDLWIICDGPIHQSGYKQVVFGARGDTHLTLKVYGPKNPLHSGHYGNWTPNPVMTLVRLLSGMKDEKGMVTVKDFYSDVIPLTGAEKKALSGLPPMDDELKKRIGFAREEMEGKSLAEAINLPSLNINGIESSNVGTIQANVIPVSATAVIDLRLVLGNDWKKQQDKVISHIASQGFYITEKEPTDEERSKYAKIVEVKRGTGNNAQRTPMEWPPASKVVAAVRLTTTDPVLQVPTLGGSLPVDVLENVLHARPLIVPIANPDNNQHAENENLRIRNFRDGIDMMASIMLMKL